MSDDMRYSRNEALFGRQGQERIATSSVAIVGVGGLGSHVAQQLSYLGVLNLLLVDHDVVTTSSFEQNGRRTFGSCGTSSAQGDCRGADVPTNSARRRR